MFYNTYIYDFYHLIIHNMPPQLKTLLPLFAIFILLFLVARHFLIPESFGKYGHYRANAIDEIAALPINYAGKAACIECHEIEVKKLASDMHTSLSCEVCHGPNAKHADDPEIKEFLVKDGTRQFCGRCHSLNPARKIEAVNQIDIKAHHPEKVNCIDCHNPHAVTEIKE
jgi:hypothetical protein